MTFDSHKVWIVVDDGRSSAAKRGPKTVDLQPAPRDFRYTGSQSRLALEVRPPEMGQIAHCSAPSASEQ